jgi:predicted RNase H-like nuclease (RuvC/YqgF family)
MKISQTIEAYERHCEDLRRQRDVLAAELAEERRERVRLDAELEECIGNCADPNDKRLILAGHIDIKMTRRTYDRNRRRVEPLR